MRLFLVLKALLGVFTFTQKPVASLLQIWGVSSVRCVFAVFDLLPGSILGAIESLLVVHSTAGSRALFSMFKSMLSEEFVQRVVWVDAVSEVLKQLQSPAATALRQVVSACVGPSFWARTLEGGCFCVRRYRLFPYAVQVEEERRVSPESVLSVFGTALGVLAHRTGVRVSASLTRVPSVLVDFASLFLQPATCTTKDLLLLQGECAALYAFVGDLDYGDPRADWADLPVVVSSFRLMLEGLPSPLFGDRAFDRAAEVAGGSPRCRRLQTPRLRQRRKTTSLRRAVSAQRRAEDATRFRRC